jgi:hypothetical protein
VSVAITEQVDIIRLKSLTDKLHVRLQSVPFNTRPLTATREHLHAQNGQINGSIEFLQTYLVVAVDALLEICTAVISALLPFHEHLSQTNTSCVPKCCYQSVCCCLIRYFRVRIRTAKRFTNSSKRFRCEVMFENEHTFCL